MGPAGLELTKASEAMVSGDLWLGLGAFIFQGIL